MKKRLKKKYHREEYDAKEARKKALQRQVEALVQTISFGLKALSDDDFSNLMAQLPHGEQKVAWKIRNTESKDKR